LFYFLEFAFEGTTFLLAFDHRNVFSSPFNVFCRYWYFIFLLHFTFLVYSIYKSSCLPIFTLFCILFRYIYCFYWWSTLLTWDCQMDVCWMAWISSTSSLGLEYTNAFISSQMHVTF